MNDYRTSVYSLCEDWHTQEPAQLKLAEVAAGGEEGPRPGGDCADGGAKIERRSIELHRNHMIRQCWLNEGLSNYWQAMTGAQMSNGKLERRMASVSKTNFRIKQARI
jgi:hypothetical protein